MSYRSGADTAEMIFLVYLDQLSVNVVRINFQAIKLYSGRQRMTKPFVRSFVAAMPQFGWEVYERDGNGPICLRTAYLNALPTARAYRLRPSPKPSQEDGLSAPMA